MSTRSSGWERLSGAFRRLPLIFKELALISSDFHRDEKAEQERRRALDEDDAEAPPPAGGDGAALDPNAKVFEPSSGTAKSTPQPGEGEQAIEGEAQAMEGVEQEEGEEKEEGEA